MRDICQQLFFPNSNSMGGNVEKAIIETSDGFVALCWTSLGLFSLKPPVPTLSDAEMQIRTDIDRLKRLGGRHHDLNREIINIKLLTKEINDYFRGKPVKFSVAVDWTDYTDFQKKVLQVVKNIPWGQVVSYGQVAVRVGNPRASRAVGGAVGSNRVLLVVPCHRVIARNGTLGGFSSGLDWKRRFLGLENIYF